MGNFIPIGTEGEMSHLQPHLGDTKLQQLRSSPFATTPQFHSQLVKDSEELLLKKGTPKNTQGFKPYQAVTSHFSPIRGIQTSEVTRVIFNPTAGAEGLVTPLLNDYLSSTNPPVGGRLLSFRRDRLKLLK